MLATLIQSSGQTRVKLSPLVWEGEVLAKMMRVTRASNKSNAFIQCIAWSSGGSQIKERQLKAGSNMLIYVDIKLNCQTTRAMADTGTIII